MPPAEPTDASEDATQLGKGLTTGATPAEETELPEVEAPENQLGMKQDPPAEEPKLPREVGALENHSDKEPKLPIEDDKPEKPSASKKPELPTEERSTNLPASPPRKTQPRHGDDPFSYTLGVHDPNATFFAVLSVMTLLSLMYLFLAPMLLWRAAGQPMALVWTFSLLVGSFMCLWTMTLSDIMGSLAVFFRSSYVVLLALTATHYISHVSGAAIVSIGTFYFAGLLGYAIAEHRQRAGTENAAYAVVDPFRGRDDQAHREELFYKTVFVQGIVTVCFVLRMVWVVSFSADAQANQTLSATIPAGGKADQILSIDRQADQILFVVEELSLESLALVWLWTDFTAIILLGEALVTLNTLILKIPCGLAVSYMLTTLLSIAVSKSTGLLFLMLMPMALSGLLGYCLAVYARYKNIKARSLKFKQG